MPGYHDYPSHDNPSHKGNFDWTKKRGNVYALPHPQSMCATIDPVVPMGNTMPEAGLSSFRLARHTLICERKCIICHKFTLILFMHTVTVKIMIQFRKTPAVAIHYPMLTGANSWFVDHNGETCVT